MCVEGNQAFLRLAGFTRFLSALQVLAMTGELAAVFPMSDESSSGNSPSSLAEYVKRLQRPDGSFAGDEFGEVDTR